MDLNDGKLQEQYEQYKKRLELAEKAGLERDKVENDLNELRQDLVKDLDYINSGKLCKYINIHTRELKSSNDTYSEKLQSNK